MGRGHPQRALPGENAEHVGGALRAQGPHHLQTAGRAWAALLLLSGQDPTWLSPSARAQVRQHLAHLADPSPEVWLSQLRRRSEVLPVYAHPAALPRLAASPHVLSAGASAQRDRGFDLVTVDEGVPEFYVPSEQWPSLARALAIRSAANANLLIRIPNEVWPFAARPGSGRGAEIGRAHV